MDKKERSNLLAYILASFALGDRRARKSLARDDIWLV